MTDQTDTTKRPWVGRISGASSTPTPDDHPVEWLRGKGIIEVAVDLPVVGVTLGHIVEVHDCQPPALPFEA